MFGRTGSGARPTNEEIAEPRIAASEPAEAVRDDVDRATDVRAVTQLVVRLAAFAQRAEPERDDGVHVAGAADRGKEHVK